MMAKKWIARVCNLGHRCKCWREYGDEADMRNLRYAKELAEEKGLTEVLKTIEDRISYLEEKMKEHEEIGEALYEHAAILERLMECRDHIIPHKHDAEIIDYIATGARHDNTAK